MTLLTIKLDITHREDQAWLVEQTYLLKVRGIVIVPVQLGKLVSIAKMLCLNLDSSPMSVQLRPEDGDALWRKALSMVLKY